MKRAMAVVLLVALAGCGVRPSGVITGGPAPRGPVEGAGLYLVSKGEVTFVLRATSRQLSPSETVALLVQGPDAGERGQGFTSEVPAGVAPVEVTSGSTGLTVTVSADVGALSTMAVDQIVCTAAGTTTPDRTVVTIVGNGRSRGPRTCPVTPG